MKSKILTLLIIISLTLTYITVSNAEENIIGGENATEGEFPSSVIIKYNWSPNVTNTFICGGSLIASEWVLTAAHCVFTVNPQAIEVIVGTNVASGATENAQVLDVRDVIIFPSYDNSSLKHDIALIKINNATLSVGIVEEVVLGFDAPEEGDSLQIIGWGAFDRQGNSISGTLKKASQIHISNSTCEDYGANVIVNRFCSIDEEFLASVCYGDSGSPTFNSRKEQIGLVSDSVSPVCNPDSPQIHTYIAPYISWINAQTGSVSTINYSNKLYISYFVDQIEN